MPAVLLCLVLGLPTGALAYWTAGGAGLANATSGDVLPPTSVTAAQLPGAGTIRIGWERSTSPDVTGYRVERSTGGGAWVAACGGTTLASTTRTCDDPGLGHLSSNRYRAVAVKGGWTATSAATPAVVIDTNRPSVTVRVAQGQANPTNSSTPANPIRFTVEFSESVTGFATGDITLGGTAGTGASATVTASSSTVYAVAVSGAATTAPGGGTVVVSVPAGVAQDGAGNLNTASGGASVLYDPNAPVLAAPTLDPLSDSGASNADRITNVRRPTFTGTVDAAEAGSTATLSVWTAASGGTPLSTATATVSSTGGYSLAPSADLPTSAAADGVEYWFSVSITDRAGNVGTSPRTGIVLDTVGPAVSITRAQVRLLAGDARVWGTQSTTERDRGLPAPNGLRVTYCITNESPCASPLGTSVTTDTGSSWVSNGSGLSLLGLTSVYATVEKTDAAGNMTRSAPFLASSVLGFSPP